MILRGYQLRVRGKISKLGWVCVKEKCGNCKRKLKKSLNYEVVNKTDHSFVSNLTGMEVKVEVDNWKKSWR